VEREYKQLARDQVNPHGSPEQIIEDPAIAEAAMDDTKSTTAALEDKGITGGEETVLEPATASPPK